MFCGNVVLDWLLPLLNLIVFRKLTFIAPKILGGENSMNPLGDFEFGEMHEIIKLSESQLSLIGDDICVKSLFKN